MAGAKKKAWQQGRQIVFVDESGFYLLAGVVRTYAPIAERPVLQPVLTRDPLSVVSAVTATAQLYAQIYPRSIDGATSLVFVQHLVEKVGGPMILIWDRASIHRAEAQAWITAHCKQQVQVEPLPAYAPELNPDEGVWQYLKDAELPNVSCINLRQLRLYLHRALMRLRSKPRLLLSFFDGAGLSLE